jgi:DNA-directed RNA polymerase subunit F
MVIRKTSEVDITASEALEILSQQEDLKQYQKLVLEYLKEVAKLPADKAKRLMEELMKEANLSRKEAVMLVNVLPKSKHEIMAILSGGKDREFLTMEKAERIKSIIDKHV